LSDPNILFVVTHPDDESLWCSSIIKTLKDWGCRVSAICLTGGDDKVRRAEYARACVVLGIPVCMMTLPDKIIFPDVTIYLKSYWPVEATQRAFDSLRLIGTLAPLRL